MSSPHYTTFGVYDSMETLNNAIDTLIETSAR